MSLPSVIPTASLVGVLSLLLFPKRSVKLGVRFRLLSEKATRTPRL